MSRPSSHVRALSRAGFAVAVLATSGAAVAGTFVGSNLGAIPDNDPAGRAISFDASGLTGEVRDVELRLTLSHSFVGDLDVRLTSPDGVAQMVVFSKVGNKRSSSAGSGANLAGTYVFRDAATGDMWSQAAANGTGTIPAAQYRTTTRGRSGLSNIGGCSTHLNQVFGGLTAAEANGVWSLRIVDTAAADTGVVTGAELRIDTSVDFRSPFSPFAGGFEDDEPAAVPPPSGTRGTCQEVLFDFTGTGLTSYAVVRNTGGGPGGAVTWFVQENDTTLNGAATQFELGTASDYFVEGDFDGDGIRDAAVWTPSPGTLKVRRSSRPGAAPLVIGLGRQGDDPQVGGDYDGDSITDFALYRAGANSGDPSFTIIRSSRTGQVRRYLTGANGQFPASGYDLTGDGVADMAMQSNAGGGMARFTIFDGTDGGTVEDYVFGTPTDVIVPGNFVGNGVFDITVIRGSGGVIQWRSRDSATDAEAPMVPFGASATDFVLSGDFDGDGLYDQAAWRSSATPGASKFLIRRSTAPDAAFEVLFGANGDYPVANSRQH